MTVTRSKRDSLITTGTNNAYFIAITLLVTLTGWMYVLNILPAYDPGILAQPHWLTFVEYLALAIGGTLVFLSTTLKDKLLVMEFQRVGLFIQTAASVITAGTVIFFGGSSSLFIALFGILVAVMHTSRLRYLKREISNVPDKRALAEKVQFAPDLGGDLTLQTLMFLQAKNDQLQDQITKGTPS